MENLKYLGDSLKKLIKLKHLNLYLSSNNIGDNNKEDV